MLEIGVAFGEKLSSKIEEHVRLYKLLGRLASLALHRAAVGGKKLEPHGKFLGTLAETLCMLRNIYGNG